jgi:hypothetical protein
MRLVVNEGSMSLRKPEKRQVQWQRVNVLTYVAEMALCFEIDVPHAWSNSLGASTLRQLATMSRTAAPRSYTQRLEKFMNAMMKLGLAPRDGLRTYEQYYDAVESLPSPLLGAPELRREAASSSTSSRRSNRCGFAVTSTAGTPRQAKCTTATVAS